LSGIPEKYKFENSYSGCLLSAFLPSVTAILKKRSKLGPCPPPNTTFYCENEAHALFVSDVGKLKNQSFLSKLNLK